MAKKVMHSGSPRDALKRVSMARTTLKLFTERQATDGASDWHSGADHEIDENIRLLCEAGFLREINVTGGGFRFRVTWKGLCFIDAVELFERTLANPKQYTANDRFLAELTVFSFY